MIPSKNCLLLFFVFIGLMPSVFFSQAGKDSIAISSPVKKPLNYDTLMARGDNYFVIGKFNLAKLMYQKALTLKKDDLITQYKIAESDYELHHIQKMGFEGSENKSQVSPERYIELGNKLMDNKNYKEAREIFKMALKIDPGNKYALKKMEELSSLSN